MLEIASFVAFAAIIYLTRQVGLLSSRIEQLEKTIERLNDKVN